MSTDATINVTVSQGGTISADLNSSTQITSSVVTGGTIASTVTAGGKGDTGLTGKSAYEIAISDGFIGTESQWLNSLVANDANFTYPFTTVSTVSVTHNLNKQPAVTVIDSAGDEVIGDVNYVSNNVVVVSFTSAFSGIIICN